MKVVSALCAAAVLASAGVASAEVTVERRQDGGFNVHYSDLDLSSAAGRDELDARIDEAAARVCRAEGRTALADFTACKAEAKKFAVEGANLRVRTALAALAGVETPQG